MQLHSNLDICCSKDLLILRFSAIFFVSWVILSSSMSLLYRFFFKINTAFSKVDISSKEEELQRSVRPVIYLEGRVDSSLLSPDFRNSSSFSSCVFCYLSFLFPFRILSNNFPCISMEFTSLGSYLFRLKAPPSLFLPSSIVCSQVYLILMASCSPPTFYWQDPIIILNSSSVISGYISSFSASVSSLYSFFFFWTRFLISSLIFSIQFWLSGSPWIWMIRLQWWMSSLTKSISLDIQRFYFQRQACLIWFSSLVEKSYYSKMFMKCYRKLQEFESSPKIQKSGILFHFFFGIQFSTKIHIFSTYLLNPMSIHRQLFRRSSGSSLGSSDLVQKKKKKRAFNIFRHDFMHRLFFRNEVYHVSGPESESFNRRTYQVPIESLQHVNNDNLGFTNQILCQNYKHNHWRLYIPVYVSLKVKSIQEISLGQLMARIGTVLVIYINVEGLPFQIIEHLKYNILVQINRGESFLLQESPDNGKVTLKEKKKYLRYVIRQTFPAQIYDDVFLSPFQILNLAFSVTFNSTQVILDKTRQGNILKTETGEPKFYHESTVGMADKVVYEISFNSMRIPLQLPIFYSSDCKLGIYDLAEKMLDFYATNKPTYSEVISSFEGFLEEEQSKCLSRSKQKIAGNNSNNGCMKKKTKVTYNFDPPEQRELSPLRMVHSQNSKQKSSKVKYYQYVHFIVPLYKFPGNGWATIFIPMFMLSLLSVFIFLQTSATISQKLGSIATFVLGFIALIPNIKAELPPSQKISFSQIIVYVESVNCMLSLVDQVFGGSKGKRYNIWTNPLFVFSVVLHLLCMTASVILLILHYTIWEKRYNGKGDDPFSSPETDYKGWNNPYCDDTFLKYNFEMRRKGDIYKQIFPWPISNYQKLKVDRILEHRQ